jgi:hypothetical protein
MAFESSPPGPRPASALTMDELSIIIATIGPPHSHTTINPADGDYFIPDPESHVRENVYTHLTQEMFEFVGMDLTIVSFEWNGTIRVLARVHCIMVEFRMSQGSLDVNGVD